MELNYRHDHRGGKLPRKVISVGGDGPYLVAMTVQRGPPPKAALSGDVVTVGGRKLRVLAHGLETLP
jgi:hypothetical protein